MKLVIEHTPIPIELRIQSFPKKSGHHLFDIKLSKQQYQRLTNLPFKLFIPYYRREFTLCGIWFNENGSVTITIYYE